MDTITTLYEQHQVLLGVVGILSASMFVASILSLPFLVSLIPTDYFQSHEPYRMRHTYKHPVIRLLILGLKNIAGWTLIVAGIIMLVLPGQGLITIAMGLLFINFPGKRKLECNLISNQKILRSINWLRAKRNKEPLLTPE